MLDVHRARACFPTLESDWALLDNAGGSAPARQVIERVGGYMARSPVQHGASYPLSREAVARVEEGRAAAARLLGAEPDEVVLGPSSTVLAQRLAEALRPLLQPGDEVVVTDLDHEANNGAWRALAAHGVVVRECTREHVDFGFRYGGDEFTVIMPETSEEQAHQIAERIRQSVEAKNFNGLTLSIGLVTYEEDMPLKTLVQEADKLMYQAKRSGGNRVVVLSREDRESKQA